MRAFDALTEKLSADSGIGLNGFTVKQTGETSLDELLSAQFVPEIR
jgi:hypothetical protein